MAMIERELIAKIESMTPEQFYHFIMSVCGAYLRQDAAPVVHGRWIPCDYKPEIYCKCSACGRRKERIENMGYCPNCGAQMIGGQNDAKTD